MSENSRSKLYQGDICDLLEYSATEAAGDADQESVQLASCPRAHACVQGLVERRFHPIHLRDFYSVINYLLLQLYSLRASGESERKASAHGDAEEVLENTSTSVNREVLKLKRQVAELQRKNRERKTKYEELYRINQQWSSDYKELQRQFQQQSRQSPPVHGGEDSEILTSPLPCQQCTTLEREVEEKTELVRDLSNNLEKLKLKDNDWAEQVKEKETTIQELLNECSALRMQFQEIGGLSAAMELRKEKEELLQEVQRLRSKNTETERERAKLQTQLNRFRQSVRQLLFADSNSAYNTQPYAANHTPYQTASSRSAAYTQAQTTPYHVTDSASQDRYDVRVPPGMSSEGYVYPKQFAPRNTGRRHPAIHFNSTASTGYKQPPTPPGLISRGKNPFSIDSTTSPPAHTRHYETHPYKPDTIAERVVGSDGPTRMLGMMPQRAFTSSQFLEPTIYQQDKLPSPMSAPRPMSAPGSLLLQQQQHPPTSFSYDTSPPHLPPTHSQSGSTHNGTVPTYYQTDYSHDTNKPRPTALKLQQDGCHGNDLTPPTITNGECKVVDGTHLYCPRCNEAFPRRLDSCDVWFDHLTVCDS